MAADPSSPTLSPRSDLSSGSSEGSCVSRSSSPCLGDEIDPVNPSRESTDAKIIDIIVNSRPFRYTVGRIDESLNAVLKLCLAGLMIIRTIVSIFRMVGAYGESSENKSIILDRPLKDLLALKVVLKRFGSSAGNVIVAPEENYKGSIKTVQLAKSLLFDGEHLQCSLEDLQNL